MSEGYFEDKTFEQINERRIELIDKKDLTKEEQIELEKCEEYVEQWDKEYYSSRLERMKEMLEQVKKIK